MQMQHVVNFRLIKHSDLPELEWDGEFIHFRRLYEEVYQRYKRGEGVMWVAEYGQEKIIGQLFISFTSRIPVRGERTNAAYIYGFRVKPDYRSQGIGSAMMSKVEEDLFVRGYKIVSLNVAQDNPAALRLYRRLGYRIMGYEAGEWSYIDHTGRRIFVKEPAWRMQKELESKK